MALSNHITYIPSVGIPSCAPGVGRYRGPQGVSARQSRRVPILRSANLASSTLILLYCSHWYQPGLYSQPSLHHHDLFILISLPAFVFTARANLLSFFGLIPFRSTNQTKPTPHLLHSWTIIIIRPMWIMHPYSSILSNYSSNSSQNTASSTLSPATDSKNSFSPVTARSTCGTSWLSNATSLM